MEPTPDHTPKKRWGKRILCALMVYLALGFCAIYFGSYSNYAKGAERFFGAIVFSTIWPLSISMQQLMKLGMSPHPDAYDYWPFLTIIVGIYIVAIVLDADEWNSKFKRSIYRSLAVFCLSLFLFNYGQWSQRQQWAEKKRIEEQQQKMEKAKPPITKAPALPPDGPITPTRQ